MSDSINRYKTNALTTVHLPDVKIGGGEDGGFGFYKSAPYRPSRDSDDFFVDQSTNMSEVQLYVCKCQGKVSNEYNTENMKYCTVFVSEHIHLNKFLGTFRYSSSEEYLLRSDKVNFVGCYKFRINGTDKKGMEIGLCFVNSLDILEDVTKDYIERIDSITKVKVGDIYEDKDEPLDDHGIIFYQTQVEHIYYAEYPIEKITLPYE